MNKGFALIALLLLPAGCGDGETAQVTTEKPQGASGRADKVSDRAEEIPAVRNMAEDGRPAVAPD